MSKEEFLYKLKQCLHGFPEDEVKDILSDYEEHFHIGISKGKSEEEISNELGRPEDIGKNYKNSYKENNHNKEIYNTNHSSNDNTRKLLIGVLLLFFNLIVVLGPYLGLAGLLLGGYGIGLAFIVGGFIALFGSPIVLFTPIPTPHILTSLGFGIGFIALGLVVIILAIYLSKLFIQLTTRYVKWNFELINR